MNKFYGTVGYIISEKDSNRPGIWIDKPVERKYFGEFSKKITKFNLTNNKVNDDVNISNELSIVSDPFANENFHNIRYVIFSKVKWAVNSVEIKYPRLILHLGGIYNG